MSEFKIREALPHKVAHLNRPLLLGIGGLILIVLLWSLLSAFDKPKSASKNSAIPSGNQSNIAPSPILQDLPKDYSDVNNIKKFTNAAPEIPPEVSQELTQLRSQQSMLETQLAEMRAKQAKPMPAADNTISPEAVKSDLFFSSTKPPSSDMTDASHKDVNNLYNNMVPNTPYAQQNMQGQKMGFLQNTATAGDVYNHYQMVQPISPYEVQAGTIVAANLLTAINTSLPGDVIAQVRQDVYDTVKGQYLLIPKGSKLLGKYDSAIAYGQERVLIAFDRIVRPDGTSIQLSNFTGSDSLGQSGFEANVDNHWGKILGAATISTMLSFGAGVAADRNTGPNNFYPGAQQSGILGAANGVSQVGQSLTNRAIDVQPTLTVPEGFSFNVIVNKDMVLAPYTGKTL
ncbi:MAG: conjugation TrbI family protein [Gammaproteobacteria bacterium]|jgi:type IV secretion system protein VirB10|nr:conjugation TrbI family protein [Gammaproteobacteria bacterium]